jgi:hypothetical protein
MSRNLKNKHLKHARITERENLKNLGIQPPEKWSPWLVACVLFIDGQ